MKYLLRLMNGEIDKMPHAKYTRKKKNIIYVGCEYRFFNRNGNPDKLMSRQVVRFRKIKVKERCHAHLLLLRHGHVIAEGYGALTGQISSCIPCARALSPWQSALGRGGILR
ncbi:MAG: hypothetical protein ACLR23_19740 [Clostridia bacterium]